MYRSCHVIKICNKFEWNLTIRGWVSALTNIWPKHLAHVPHVAIRSWIIFTKFELGQPIRSWLIMCSVLICYVTLWPWRSTSWPWTFVIHRMSHDQSLYRIWAKKTMCRWVIDYLPSLCHWFFVCFCRFFRERWKRETAETRERKRQHRSPQMENARLENARLETVITYLWWIANYVVE